MTYTTLAECITAGSDSLTNVGNGTFTNNALTGLPPVEPYQFVPWRFTGFAPIATGESVYVDTYAEDEPGYWSLYDAVGNPIYPTFNGVNGVGNAFNFQGGQLGLVIADARYWYAAGYTTTPNQFGIWRLEKFPTAIPAAYGAAPFLASPSGTFTNGTLIEVFTNGYFLGSPDPVFLSIVGQPNFSNLALVNGVHCSLFAPASDGKSCRINVLEGYGIPDIAPIPASGLTVQWGPSPTPGNNFLLTHSSTITGIALDGTKLVVTDGTTPKAYDTTSITLAATSLPSPLSTFTVIPDLTVYNAPVVLTANSNTYTWTPGGYIDVEVRNSGNIVYALKGSCIISAAGFQSQNGTLLTMETPSAEITYDYGTGKIGWVSSSDPLKTFPNNPPAPGGSPFVRQINSSSYNFQTYQTGGDLVVSLKVGTIWITVNVFSVNSGNVNLNGVPLSGPYCWCGYGDKTGGIYIPQGTPFLGNWSPAIDADGTVRFVNGHQTIACTITSIDSNGTPTYAWGVPEALDVAFQAARQAFDDPTDTMWFSGVLVSVNQINTIPFVDVGAGSITYQVTVEGTTSGTITFTHGDSAGFTASKINIALNAVLGNSQVVATGASLASLTLVSSGSNFGGRPVGAITVTILTGGSGIGTINGVSSGTSTCAVSTAGITHPNPATVYGKSNNFGEAGNILRSYPGWKTGTPGSRTYGIQIVIPYGTDLFGSNTTQILGTGEAFNRGFQGTAVSGTTTTVVLPSNASSQDGAYTGGNPSNLGYQPSWVRGISGTGAGQLTNCIGYVGATRTCTLDPALTTPFDEFSVIAVEGNWSRGLIVSGPYVLVGYQYPIVLAYDKTSNNPATAYIGNLNAQTGFFFDTIVPMLASQLADGSTLVTAQQEGQACSLCWVIPPITPIPPAISSYVLIVNSSFLFMGA